MTYRIRIFKKLSLLLLCVVLLLPTPVSAADLNMTAINDRVLPLSANTMPLWSGGLLYLPYTVFSKDVSGVDLGFTTSYNRSEGIVAFYSTREILVFDLKTGSSRDEITGETYLAKAVVRNGIPYVPLNMICSFFGLERSYLATDHGHLVRIKNDDVVLSDEMFIEAAKDLINRQVREYYQSLNPAPETPQTPDTTDPPPPEQEPSESVTEKRTFLAFRCRSSEGLSDILDVLDAQGEFALFFMTPQALEESGLLVQRILGTGHSIGLMSEESDLEYSRYLLEEGNHLLEQMAYTRTTTAYVPKAQRSTLSEEGWICWSETLSLEPSDTVGANTFASNTISRLKNRSGSIYLTLDCSSNSTRILPSLLRQLENHSFVLSTPLETRL
ncbi:MAG: hypothetical protein ACOX7N_03525 [Lawsonibacter sp.]|jgi:hypothetical protein